MSLCFKKKKKFLKPKQIYILYTKKSQKEKKKNEQCGLYTINWVSFLTVKKKKKQVVLLFLTVSWC